MSWKCSVWSDTQQMSWEKRKRWPNNWSNKPPHYVVQLFWYNLVCRLHHNIRISHPSGGSDAVTAAHIARIYAYKGLHSVCKCIFWKLIFFLRHTTVIKKLEWVLFSAAERRWQKWAQQKCHFFWEIKKRKTLGEGFIPPKQPFVFRFI